MFSTTASGGTKSNSRWVVFFCNKKISACKFSIRDIVNKIITFLVEILLSVKQKKALKPS